MEYWSVRVLDYFLTPGVMKITRNMSTKLYPDFIPIYGYMISGVRCQVSGVRIQLPGASVLTLEPLNPEPLNPEPLTVTHS